MMISLIENLLGNFVLPEDHLDSYQDGPALPTENEGKQ